MQKKIRRYLLLIILFNIIPSVSLYADILDEFRKKATESMNDFRAVKKNDLEAFRRQINEEIAKAMENPWAEVDIMPGKDVPPQPTPVPPIYLDPDTVDPTEPQEIIIKERITVPVPEPQPQPIEPIVEILPDEREPIVPLPEEPTPEDPTPKIITMPDDKFEFKLYGTRFAVRYPELKEYRKILMTPENYARAWRVLNSTSTNNLILDCLAAREEKCLGDWAFMNVALALAHELFPEEYDKATLLAGFILCQSGYRIRFASDNTGRLHLLYSPSGVIYNAPSLCIDNHSYYFAPIPHSGNNSQKGNTQYKVCSFNSPGEKALNFELLRQMALDYSAASPRNVTVHNYPDISVEVTVNANLIDFYNSYPEFGVDNTPYSKWVAYADAPASPELRRDLYPALKEAVKELSEGEAANLLIHLAESFPYGYDDKIWGYDRAFFPDESWFYPYSDCEDHAIHFTRLVRDILDLDAVLVYYPGHLASAVAFTDTSVKGDYVIHEGKKYIICDPTIFYADIGTTMRGLDNTRTILINLRKE